MRKYVMDTFPLRDKSNQSSCYLDQEGTWVSLTYGSEQSLSTFLHPDAAASACRVDLCYSKVILRSLNAKARTHTAHA